MSEHTIKMPDVGEGVAEAELVEWNVKPGDLVREDDVLAAVMTDKATVEIPSPVEGEITWLGAEVGDTVSVGSPIVRIKTAGGDSETGEGEVTETTAAEPEPEKATDAPLKEVAKKPEKKPADEAHRQVPTPRTFGAPRAEGEKPVASPAVRLRAREAGIDLRQVPGSGPAGRILHEDIDAYLRAGPSPAGAIARHPDTSVEEVKIIGLRRRIAEKMALAKSRIPHITYVEEIDVTALEDLRASLNISRKSDRPKLTILPFLIQAMVVAIRDQPALNAHFDDDAGVVRRYGGVHVGIAAQTDAGLVVPVVRHAEARDLWDSATEVNRLAEAARAGTATREELSGSTITITSLGAMGGVATTPVINHPEVAIVGVNKIMVRPVWDGAAFQPRKMMNLSSSFDHRVIDGWDAARFIQRIKALLETPAMIFVEA
ncbi:MAG: 2-oxo acid dehydrogenase subunit E2 [Rhizobiaceae bacterium]|nr:2-oxo acid dehydrogenase subunit E2 [Rhizobiaceae bacterium]